MGSVKKSEQATAPKGGTVIDMAPVALYVDGGVIGVNPSPHGGTYAWRRVVRGTVTAEGSGYIVPYEGLQTISNMVSEMIALVNGIEKLPEGWYGAIYSDSLVTLRRFFQESPLEGLPQSLVDRMYACRKKLNPGNGADYTHYPWFLLDGHPTREQLARGFGKRGYPVSEHNVACDAACSKLAEAFKASLV